MNKNSRPRLVSVGVPVFNGEKYLRDSIESILRQTYTNIEIIVSDNASSDKTGAICQEFASRDLRIKYIRQSHNLGAARNFQYVLDESSGEYFMWAAADDWNNPKLIEMLVKVLDQYPSVALVTSNVQCFDDTGTDLEEIDLNSIRLERAIDQKIYNTVQFLRNPTSNVYMAIYGLFRSSVVKTAQVNFNGAIKYASGSEIPFLAQIALSGLIVSIPSYLKKYRRHSNSTYSNEQNQMGFWTSIDNRINISQNLLKIIVQRCKGVACIIFVFPVLVDMMKIPVFGLKLFMNRIFNKSK